MSLFTDTILYSNALSPHSPLFKCHVTVLYKENLDGYKVRRVCSNLALFAPSIFFYLSGTVVFALFGSAEQQQFDNNDSFA